MTVDVAHDLLQTALMTTMSVVAPLLAAIVLVSLVVNVLQTMTQLHDQALAFVPRIVMAGVLMLLLLPWLLGRVTDYAVDVYRAAGNGS
jgi:flagellar biosynthetic protein FliQ